MIKTNSVTNFIWYLAEFFLVIVLMLEKKDVFFKNLEKFGTFENYFRRRSTKIEEKRFSKFFMYFFLIL